MLKQKMQLIDHVDAGRCVEAKDTVELEGKDMCVEAKDTVERPRGCTSIC